MTPIITRKEWIAENLPAGLTMSSGGIITGKPTVEGIYDVPVTVRTNWGTDTKSIHISVEKKIKWTARDILDYENGTRYYAKGFLGLTQGYCGKGNIIFHCTNVNSNDLYGCGYRIDDNDGSVRVVKICTNSLTSYKFSAVYGFITSYGQLAWILGTKSSSNRLITYIKLPSSYPSTNGAAMYKDTVSSSIATSITPKAGFFDNNGNVWIFSGAKAFKIANAIYGTTSLDSTAYSVGITANYRCAAYNTQSGIMCVLSNSGDIRVTSNNWTSKTSGTAPDNLLELTYRADLNKFFAVGENTGLFYVSEDGLNWEQFNNTPVPLTTVKSMAYDASAGYCVIGTAPDGTDKHTYHSQDGENWTEAILPFDNNTYTVNNVVYSSYLNDNFVIKTSYTRYLYTLSKTDLWGN